MPAEKVALSDQFANRETYTDGLRDNLAGHLLMTCEDPAVRHGCRYGVLFHGGANELIEVKEKRAAKVGFVVGFEYDRSLLKPHLIAPVAAPHSRKIFGEWNPFSALRVSTMSCARSTSAA